MIRSNAGNRTDEEQGEDPLSPVSSNGGGAGSGGMFKMNEAQFPLVLVILTSFVLMLSVVTWEYPIKSYGYAVAVPVVSLLLSIGYLLLTIFQTGLYNLYGNHMTHILFMWNFTGACFLTFSSPFTTTGNGYFAAWGCVATSAMAMGFTGDAFRSRVQGLGSLLGLGASSAIVVIALIDYVGANAQNFSRKESIYAMVVAVFTVLLVAGIMFFQSQHGTKAWFARSKFGALAFFAFLWMILACLVTFSGPFNTTGNGYFASWAGATCASFATFNAWTELGISTEDIVGFLAPASNADGPTGLSATIS